MHRPLHTYARPQTPWLWQTYASFLPQPKSVKMRKELYKAVCALAGVFRFSCSCCHAKSYMRREQDGRLVANGNFTRCFGGETYQPLVSSSLLLRHLMQGRELHEEACVWLHLDGTSMTRLFAIDIDAHGHTKTADILPVYRIVLATLGTPAFAVTSRNGKGFHLWYFLDRNGLTDKGYPLEDVRDVVVSILKQKGLAQGVGAGNDYEFLPIVSKATPPVPFGINAYPCDPKGNVAKMPSELALLAWYRDFRATGLKRLKMKDLGRLAQKLISKKPVKLQPRPSSRRKKPSKSGKKPPWFRNPRKVTFVKQDFEILDKTGLTSAGQRYNATFLLQQYAFFCLRLSLTEAIDFAIDWFDENHNDCSAEWIRNRKHAVATLTHHFTKWWKGRDPDPSSAKPPCISKAEFVDIVSAILAHSKRIEREAERLKIAHPNRYRKGLLSFMAYLYGFARANGRKTEEGFYRVGISNKRMKNIPLASRNPVDRYARLLRGRVFNWMKPQDEAGRDELRRYTFHLKPRGKPNVFESEDDFLMLCCHWLTDEQGSLFFGTGWKRVQACHT